MLNYIVNMKVDSLMGFGFGFKKNENNSLTPRFKIWGGQFILLSYEYINFKNDKSKYHYGLFGILPLTINVIAL